MEVHNKVTNITSKTSITWRCVYTIQKDEDIARRRSNIGKLPKEWWDEPRWLPYHDDWPKQRKLQQQRNLKKKQR